MDHEPEDDDLRGQKYRILQSTALESTEWRQIGLWPPMLDRLSQDPQGEERSQCPEQYRKVSGPRNLAILGPRDVRVP
jgi:hypothetical protein